MSANNFQGVEKFLRAQLQQDYSYVKRGEPAPASQRVAIQEIRTINDQHPHTCRVRLGTLHFFLSQLGLEAMLNLAKHNLSDFTFRRACGKAIDKLTN